MYLFILGFVFGMGLTLAVRSVDKTMQLRRIHRQVQYERDVAAAAAQLAESKYYGWGSVETGIGATARHAEAQRPPAATW